MAYSTDTQIGELHYNKGDECDDYCDVPNHADILLRHDGNGGFYCDVCDKERNTMHDDDFNKYIRKARREARREARKTDCDYTFMDDKCTELLEFTKVRVNDFIDDLDNNMKSDAIDKYVINYFDEDECNETIRAFGTSFAKMCFEATYTKKQIKLMTRKARLHCMTSLIIHEHIKSVRFKKEYPELYYNADDETDCYCDSPSHKDEKFLMCYNTLWGGFYCNGCGIMHAELMNDFVRGEYGEDAEWLFICDKQLRTNYDIIEELPDFVVLHNDDRKQKGIIIIRNNIIRGDYMDEYVRKEYGEDADWMLMCAFTCIKRLRTDYDIIEELPDIIVLDDDGGKQKGVIIIRKEEEDEEEEENEEEEEEEENE